ANSRAALVMVLSDPSTLYGSPTTISAGCHSRSSASITSQRGPPKPTGTVSRGAAVRLMVSPQATPMRRRPKSNARITRGAPLAGPLDAAFPQVVGEGRGGLASDGSGTACLGLAGGE